MTTPLLPPMRSFGNCIVIMAAASLGTGVNHAAGQTYSVLHEFNGVPEGALPRSGITLDKDGNLYSMAQTGGTEDNYGTVFKSDPSGKISVLHEFDRTDGSTPEFGTMALLKSTLYGSTPFGGGTSLCGVLFSLNTDGSAYTVLHTFQGPDGCWPEGALQPVPGHGLVGVTSQGGESYSSQGVGSGTLFILDRYGAYRRLHNFGKGSDGAGPNAVFIDSAGNVFGSTGGGGPACAPNSHGCGTIFEYNLATRHYSTLYTFTGEQDGEGPILGSIGPDGTLYGVTSFGTGVAHHGTLFQLTPSGNSYKLETLIDFPQSLAQPESGPTLSAHGDLVGVAGTGLYVYNHGTRKLLQAFTTNATGLQPLGQPAIGPGGIIYGTTYAGGIAPCVISQMTQYPDGCGVLYEYNPN